jgi:exodeoxyribonuclease VII large subunit
MEQPLSITELTHQVKDLIEEEFPSVWVMGEISEYRQVSSGHVYLTLKDDRSALLAVIWRGIALRLKTALQSGMKVVARGRIEVYAPHGKYQLIIETIQPQGVGAAELALRQLMEKLRDRGYFAPERKRPLPRFPKRLAVVSSATGAAVRDILELTAKRWPLVEVIVRHSRVQGDGAGAEIAAAIEELNRVHTTKQLPIDAMIVGRGGGSSDDLASFNEEIVADAIFRSQIPVVSAVGHEIDVSIADLVADARAETPSAAVMQLVPDRLELLRLLGESNSRLTAAVAQAISDRQRRLDQLSDRPALRRPLDRIRDRELRLDELSARLVRSVQQGLRRTQDRLKADAAALQSLSPLNVLARGYSVTRLGPSILRNAKDVAPGQLIETRLQHGAVTSRVETTTPETPR